MTEIYHMFPLRPVLVKTGTFRDLIAVVTKLCLPFHLKARNSINERDSFLGFPEHGQIERHGVTVLSQHISLILITLLPE